MKKKTFVWIIAILVVATNVVLLMNQNSGNQSEFKDVEHQNFPKANHDVIRINGDGDFTSANGVVSGDGTTHSPYLISGWTIDATGKGVGIYIANTTVNFTIVNCEVYGASGGDYGVYYPNSGIYIHNAKASVVWIMHNKLHNNTAAGLHISNDDMDYIRVYNNTIYFNSRAGIYVAYTSGLGEVNNNMIFNNSVGIHLTHDSPSTTAYIHHNGVANNHNEAIRLEYDTNQIVIYSNIFYKNNGLGGHFDPSQSQASQTGCSDVYWTYWSGGVGNFWYDLAMNNETNYNKTTMQIDVEYPIGGSDGAYDGKPVRGVYHDHVWMDWVDNSYNDSKTFNIDTGVIAGLGTSYSPYIISGWNISGHDGYGLVFNKYFYDISSGEVKYINVDGIVISNISQSSNYLLYSGIGIGINSTGHGHITIANATIYDCDNYGIAVQGATGYSKELVIKEDYIHDNLAGMGVFNYTDSYGTEYPEVYFANSTVDSNSHAGIYVPSGDLTAVNLIISHNDIGIDVEYSGSVKVSYSSLYKNTRWGVYVGNSNDLYATVKYNIFYGNNGATGAYSPSHIQAYSDALADVHFTGNVYYDWINNNRSNDLDNDGIIDWHYKIDGSAGLNDSTPAKWNHVGYPIYIDGDNDLNIAPYRGTGHGIIGGSGTGSEPYLIMGWNVTEGNTNGPTATISIKNITKSYIDIRYVRTEGEMDDGIYLYNDSKTVRVYNSYIVNCYFVGLRIEKTPFFIVSYNEIKGSKAVAGIEVADVDGGWAYIENNKIYRNSNDHDSVGIYVYQWDPDNNGLGLYIQENQIFANDNGTYVYGSSNVHIWHNGFAYNTHYGVVLWMSDKNYVYNNMFYWNNNSHDGYNPHYQQAYDNGNNYWNDTNGHGNYWQDWALNNETNDQNPQPNGDNIVDWPYHIYGGNSADHYPFLYVDHDPIRINGLGDLDWDHGYVGGDGSMYYPYLILGWDINGNGAGYGLYVANLTGEIYFRIEHCIITSTSGGSGSMYYSNSGIIIYKFEGYEMDVYDTISGYNDGKGLYIEDSWWIEVSHSYFQGSYNTDGVDIYNSHYVHISYTNMSNNKYEGLFVNGGSNVKLEYNVFYKNGGEGVWIYTTSNDDSLYGSIYNNTFRNNTGYGLELMSSSGFTVYHNIFDRNNGASGDGQYDSDHKQAYDDAAQYANKWNTTSEGNCWSDYTGTGAYAIAGGNSADEQPGCGFVPEFQGYLFVVLALVGLAGFIHVRRRRH